MSYPSSGKFAQMSFTHFKFRILYPHSLERGLYCNHLVRPSVRPSVRTDISASTRGIDFKFCIQLLLDELQDHLCFQVCQTSTSCLPGRLVLFFRLKISMFKFFVTDFSASTGGNDFKFCIQLQHDELYRASPFQVCRASTSCLPSRLRQFSA